MTDRSAWAAPSSPADSTGTMIFSLLLAANLERVSSCRTARSSGVGADRLRRADIDDLDSVDAYSPLVGHRLHLLLQLGVDVLALGKGLVERDAAEDRAQRGARELVDGDGVAADGEERLLGVDDLA